MNLLINDIHIDIPHVVTSLEKRARYELNQSDEYNYLCDNEFYIPNEYVSIIYQLQNNYKDVVIIFEYKYTQNIPHGVGKGLAVESTYWIRISNIEIFEPEYMMGNRFILLKVRGKYIIETEDMSIRVIRQRKIDMLLNA